MTRVAQKVGAGSPPERVHAASAPGMVMRRKMRIWTDDDFSMVSHYHAPPI
jgi:hypothetical protein